MKPILNSFEYQETRIARWIFPSLCIKDMSEIELKVTSLFGVRTTATPPLRRNHLHDEGKILKIIDVDYFNFHNFQ